MLNELAKNLPDNPQSFRDAIANAEDYLKDFPQTELPLKHHFSKGTYAREIFMPKGTYVTGKIHKTEHLCILFGDIEIGDEGGMFRYTGYHVFNSFPGTKRILATYEDTWFTTIHLTDETDIPTLEADIACETYEQYGQHLIESQHREVLP